MSVRLLDLRLSSVSSGGAGAPLSPDVAGGTLNSLAFGDLNGPGANSNLYQECTGRSAMMMAHAADAAAESNNNNMVLHKKLSLDIPPAEPAPSPR